MSVAEFTSTLNDMIKAASKVATFVFGDVTAVSPLVITVEGLPPLSGDLLIVGANCRERRAYLDKHKHVISEKKTENPILEYPEHIHPISQHNTENAQGYIIINRALRVGDKVLMLRANDGQQYYLLERIEGDMECFQE